MYGLQAYRKKCMHILPLLHTHTTCVVSWLARRSRQIPNSLASKQVESWVEISLWNLGSKYSIFFSLRDRPISNSGDATMHEHDRTTA